MSGTDLGIWGVGKDGATKEPKKRGRKWGRTEDILREKRKRPGSKRKENGDQEKGKGGRD